MHNPACLLLAACALLPLPAGAQGERYAIRPVPAPNQALRVRMAQEMAFDARADNLPDAMKLELTMTLAGRQRVGPADSAGRISGAFSYDTIAMDLRMNGQSMPMPSALAEGLVGKTFTVIWDAAGKVAEVRAPPEAGGIGVSVTDLIKGLAGSLPDITLAVGDTASVLSAFTLPVPGVGGTGQDMQTRVRFQLVGVEREGGERIAVLEQWMEAGVEAAAVRMTGTGRMRWNLDRSVPQLVTTDAELHASVALPGMGTMQLSGTVRMRMSTLPDPGTAPPP